MPVIPGSHNLLSNQIFLQCFSQSLGQPLSFHSHLIGYQVLETLCPKYVSKCPPTSSIPVSFKPLAFLEGETNSFCTPLPVHSHFYSSFPSTHTHIHQSGFYNTPACSSWNNMFSSPAGKAIHACRPTSRLSFRAPV